MELREFVKLVPTGKEEAAWATHMIKRADSYINMRLNRRYGDYIPFSPVPDAVWSMSITLSIYYCLLSNYAGQSIDKVEALTATYYRPVVEQLNWLSKGNLELPEIDGDSDTMLIDSTTDDYQKEFRISREDTEGTTIVDGNMDEGEW
jgi:hypothetical protein